MKFKSDLGHIRQRNQSNRSKQQNNVTFNNYAKDMSRNIYKSKQGTGLKILTPKQMLQKLPIALAQIKAGNN